MRRSSGLNDKHIMVVSTRHHERVYSLVTLIRAVPSIVKSNPRVRFLLVGEGSETPSLKRMVSRLGIAESVSFVGRAERSKVLRYLQIADIYVSTSLSDGSSASLMEAMTCKVPAIVSDIPGNREWIHPERNGFLFRVADSKALSEAILRVAASPSLRTTMAEEAYETITKQADWNLNGAALTERIQALAALHST
jgi:glycosyltransferase involved in cell wall biosynthesis